MADLARVKRNVAKMVDMGAPETDIDAYIAEEGTTIDEVRAFKGSGSQFRFGAGAIKADPSRTAEQSANVERAAPAPMRNDLLTSTAATLNGITGSVPFLQQASDAIMGGGAALLGGDYGETVRGLQERRGQINQAAPIANVAGSVAGSLGGLYGAGLTRVGAEALGMTGGLGQRVLNSGLSNAGIATASSLANGQGGTDALTAGATAGALGAGIPVVGAGIGAGARAFGNSVLRPIATAFSRENEAIGRVGRAHTQGQRSAGREILTAEDEQVARQLGAPVINADRGGAPLRTLARTAANINSEASSILRRVSDDRFEGQADRATSFIRRMMGGATDDLALQEALETRARASNRPAYRAAYDAPEGQAVWTPQIRQLMQSDLFRRAIDGAESRGTNQAAINGGRAVRNPFVFREDGTVTLRELPGGGRALPNLEFWDQVQRNLRIAGRTAARGGDDTTAAEAQQMRRILNEELDARVPQFRAARRGAFEFFQAEDALEAGRNAVSATGDVPEMRRAVNQMTAADRQAASVGYASSLIDNIRKAGDRQNVINRLFRSPARRELNEMFLGPQRAREIEAMVRVEGILDNLRTAVSGNSSTAQQLLAAGALGTAGGFFASGGDIQTTVTWGAIAAAGRRGLQVMGKRVDEDVMRRVAEILASDDPRMIDRAIQNAQLSQQHMDALRAIGMGLETAAKGTALGAMSASATN